MQVVSLRMMMRHNQILTFQCLQVGLQLHTASVIAEINEDVHDQVVGDGVVIVFIHAEVPYHRRDQQDVLFASFIGMEVFQSCLMEFQKMEFFMVRVS
jgi:hypothetical protein